MGEEWGVESGMSEEWGRSGEWVSGEWGLWSGEWDE